MKDLKKEQKEKVLEEIMKLMDMEEGEELKTKSPKFMKVETNDPEVAEKLLKKADAEVPAESEVEPDMEDEDEERLKELYSKLK